MQAVLLLAGSVGVYGLSVQEVQVCGFATEVLTPAVSWVADLGELGDDLGGELGVRVTSLPHSAGQFEQQVGRKAPRLQPSGRKLCTQAATVHACAATARAHTAALCIQAGQLVEQADLAALCSASAPLRAAAFFAGAVCAQAAAVGTLALDALDPDGTRLASRLANRTEQLAWQAVLAVAAQRSPKHGTWRPQTH